MPQASIFDHFQIGDISIGNKGVEGKDVANIFQSMAQVEAIQDAREREERRQRMQLATISVGVVTTILLVIFLFYIFTKQPIPKTPPKT